MIELSERLNLTNELRYEWLQANDGYLLSELSSLFGRNLFVRGSKIDNKLALEHFQHHPEVDYFIYSSVAPTSKELKYAEKSRILFYRTSKRWGSKWFRRASCRHVRLKQQILTIFEEELVS